MADALRMARRVFDGDRCALRNTEQREPVETRGIGDAFEVAHLVFEGQVGVGAVGQPLPRMS